MKRFMAFVAVATFLTLFVVSCGSSKGHCDAYGSVNNVENADLASK
ncbi:MAG TPA: hypothetical protein PLI97_03770 [Fluviicola sp.]|nr:hypothetical protein [Fluviicola sp.]